MSITTQKTHHSVGCLNLSATSSRRHSSAIECSPAIQIIRYGSSLLPNTVCASRGGSRECAVKPSQAGRMSVSSSLLHAPETLCYLYPLPVSRSLTTGNTAGILLGAVVPIILTSRADSVRTRMASPAVGALYAHHRTEQRVQAGSRARAIWFSASMPAARASSSRPSRSYRATSSNWYSGATSRAWGSGLT